MLRGQKKDKAPKLWGKKQNQLRKLRDRDREKDTKLVRRRDLVGDDVVLAGDGRV